MWPPDLTVPGTGERCVDLRARRPDLQTVPTTDPLVETRRRGYRSNEPLRFTPSGVPVRTLQGPQGMQDPPQDLQGPQGMQDMQDIDLQDIDLQDIDLQDIDLQDLQHCRERADRRRRY